MPEALPFLTRSRLFTAWSYLERQHHQGYANHDNHQELRGPNLWGHVPVAHRGEGHDAEIKGLEEGEVFARSFEMLDAAGSGGRGKREHGSVRLAHNGPQRDGFAPCQGARSLLQWPLGRGLTLPGVHPRCNSSTVSAVAQASVGLTSEHPFGWDKPPALQRCSSDRGPKV